jgi:hypothetical protein
MKQSMSLQNSKVCFEWNFAIVLTPNSSTSKFARTFLPQCLVHCLLGTANSIMATSFQSVLYDMKLQVI